MATVSHHAVLRYIERFAPDLSEQQAREVLMRSAMAIDVAALLGASAVKMGNGARLVLKGDVVATVKASAHAACTPASAVMKKRWGKARRARWAAEAQ